MYNDFGNKLAMQRIDDQEYDHEVQTQDGVYRYRALKDMETGKLIVYLPENN